MDNLPKEEILNKDTPPIENENGDKGPSIEEEGELDIKTKTGFQQLVAKKDNAIKESEQQLAEANRKLKEYEAAKHEEELAKMTEAEKLKAERDDYASKYAKAELKSFVTAELMKRNLMQNPLAEDIIESPWMLRAVKSHLSAQPTWDETIEAVKEFLPNYLDTLIVPAGNNGTPNGEPVPNAEDGDKPSAPMPSERGEPPVTPGNKRTWTKSEIDAIKKDNQKWLKYREEITLAYSEGRVI